MTDSSTRTTFKLAALDLDGTLLAPDLSISPENLCAVRSMAEQGMQIVIATGRHYTSVLPLLRPLPEVRWIISVQGAEVADRERRVVLARRFMEPAHVELAVTLAERAGLTPLVYSPDGVLTTQPENDDLIFYRQLAGLVPGTVSRDALTHLPVFKVIWLGAPEQVAAAMNLPVPSQDFERVQTHRRIIEFVPNNVSKATGLQALAEHLGIAPAAAVVFGDADNDVPMFKWAGCSVAMACGWPSAIAAAVMVSPPGPPATALARAVDVLLG